MNTPALHFVLLGPVFGRNRLLVGAGLILGLLYGLATACLGVNATVQVGDTISLSVASDGTQPLSYQWLMDGAELPGATKDTLQMTVPENRSLVRLQARVSNRSGSALSDEALILLAEPSAIASIKGRISNVSVRSVSGVEGSPLIVGFVSASGAGLPVLLRATGPSLSDFGVTGCLADPELLLFDGKQLVDSNRGWGSFASLSTLLETINRVGAFPYKTMTTRDSALLATVSGPRTAHVRSSELNSQGVVLFEVYDLGGKENSFLANASALNYAGVGADTLILGFTVAGPGPVKVLVRAVGPSLLPFGVTDVIADPRLELHLNREGTDLVIARNDDWSGAADIGEAFYKGGAFQIPVYSRDAAIVALLPAGNYTALVSGANAAKGKALIELYDVSN